MGIVNNPHGHPTKSVSSKNPIPRVTLKIKILDWLNFSAVGFRASGLGKNVKVSLESGLLVRFCKHKQFISNPSSISLL